MKTEMKLFFSKQMLLSTFVAIFLSLNFGVSFASIEATDIQGNKYILNDDGTYKKLDKKSLSNKEVASGIVAAIRTYKTIFGTEVSDNQASCLNEMILDNVENEKQIKSYYKKNDNKQRLFDELLNDKLFDKLTEYTKIKVVEQSTNELRKQQDEN